MKDAGSAPLVSVVMGSASDWETMRHASERLREFGVPHECRVVSAHRTPDLLATHAAEAEAKGGSKSSSPARGVRRTCRA